MAEDDTAGEIHRLCAGLSTDLDSPSLDAARAFLDTLDVSATFSAIFALLDWRRVPAAAARRERARLVSYAAIMHGSGLLGHLSEMTRLLIGLFGDQEPLVSEELLRTIGNLARYVLATHSSGPPLPADALRSLLAPLIGAAGAHVEGESTLRSRFCFLALHRALLELPDDLLQPEAMLPTTRSLLKMLASLEGQPPAEALAPLTRAAQLVGVHLAEVDLHFIVQHGVSSMRVEDSPTMRGAVELLRLMAPLLRARADEPFARELSRWVSDEVALLPRKSFQQLSVQDLAAAFEYAQGPMAPEVSTVSTEPGRKGGRKEGTKDVRREGRKERRMSGGKEGRNEGCQEGRKGGREEGREGGRDRGFGGEWRNASPSQASLKSSQVGLT